jgi:uncharacterized protein YprB with RNaseH-like and TPR domain
MLKSFIKPNLNYKPSLYISATEFENFINNDLLCDWLSIVHPKKDYKNPLQSLFNKGIHYESFILDKLRKKFQLELPKLSSLSTSREYTEYEHKEDLKITLKNMREGIPLLYSPFIASDIEELRGIPDLLVRNDYIEKFFGVKDVPLGSSIFGEYYYIPIEIKYSSLYFDKSIKTILNINRTKIYKTQLCVYSKILCNIQGHFPCCAFIIGKNTEYLGHVYFQTRDNDIVKLFYEGLTWLRYIKENAYKIDFSVKLLPNMKINNSIYDDEKKKIAEYYGEITEFWQCSIKHRYNLLDNTNNTIFSWKDPNFKMELLQTNPSYKFKLDKLFKINRDEIDPIYPKKIIHNHYNWRDDMNEIFVDFETTGDPNENDECVIFLIGVYQKNKEYIYFKADDISDKSEKKIILDFYSFWKKLGNPKVWYWYAENSFWDRVCKKYNISLNIDWVDLYKVFFDGNVFIKGCKNFKLKSYIYSLKELKIIDISYPPKECCNGLNALCLGYEYYETKDKGILNSILEYNKFDCVCLEVLLGFIRKYMK